MAEEAVLVATGADRPGVMDELSQFLLENGGNITDSHAVNLRGYFAMLLLVRASPEAMQKLSLGLGSLSGRGINAQLHDASSSPRKNGSFPYIFTASGKDQAGVLHRISHLLRVLKINIDGIETQVAPDSSFEIRLALAIPRETPITLAREYLTVLCKELGITGTLNEA
jgi:glycine cleavage system transcriptional repressor